MNKPQITCICALNTASAKKFERMFIYVLDGACCMKAKRIRIKGFFIGGGVLNIIKGVISSNYTFQKEHYDKYPNQKCLLFGALTDQLYSLTTLTYH